MKTRQEPRVDGQSETMDVSVWRGGEDGAYQTYQVPAYESQTILDVVSWIQQYEDPTLTYRFACRVGMCGSCAMMVNGAPRWTCRTHVKKVLTDGAIQVGPLRNLPVIKDLAADMDPFFDKWVAAGGVHTPSASRDEPIAPVDPDGDDRVTASAGIECINCSVCYAACDTVAGNDDYLGPAALQRAWTLYNDTKHDNRAGILEAVSGAGGCHNCHSMGSCTFYCPNELDPMAAIAGLKRETARSFFRRRKG
ncbi:succinate dehydrogenase/fumarate reductase iron-sulfur subunit [Roseobacter ponti]|uniref:Succinate dehydrogenase iron-sulfur subunit n=1 Tax=Roseobacter ponti TaxID=1891787 RepID=A0A858SVV5_9RHOB|nr:2Fe-2S iron-sulfur cluster-binding protein [Roseobacter ponti]QJF51783.1 succinate dehydrogenase/fumarate reductase iron-sulfur subunit [Roseobacter ponti]